MVPGNRWWPTALHQFRFYSTKLPQLGPMDKSALDGLDTADIQRTPGHYSVVGFCKKR